jgi:hypothetical protein
VQQCNEGIQPPQPVILESVYIVFERARYHDMRADPALFYSECCVCPVMSFGFDEWYNIQTVDGQNSVSSLPTKASPPLPLQG